jgi:hypothetical protein
MPKFCFQTDLSIIIRWNRVMTLAYSILCNTNGPEIHSLARFVVGRLYLGASQAPVQLGVSNPTVRTSSIAQLPGFRGRNAPLLAPRPAIYSDYCRLNYAAKP